MSCIDYLATPKACVNQHTHSFAEFFVVNIDVLTFFACIIGVIVHVRMEKEQFASSGYLKNLLVRVFASANAPMIPALFACALFTDLIGKLQGVTVNLLVAAFACAYVTALAFTEP